MGFEDLLAPLSLMGFERFIGISQRGGRGSALKRHEALFISEKGNNPVSSR